MELTKEQLLEIDNYVYACGIKYYDVRTEIVDHFATILEVKLDDNPNLDFRKEIKNIHRNFSDKGFSKLLKEKTKSVHKIFYNQSFKHLISFIRLPKIIISGALFYILLQIMNVIEDKQDFFLFLNGFGLVLVTLIFVRVFVSKKRNKEIFLKLDMNACFLQLINFIIISFNTISSFRNEESFYNATHNYVQLGLFVVVLLFYWSGEYVFYQNKKDVEKQYPNILA